MTWTKVPDDATETLWDLSAGAFRLHVSGLVYANRHLTDGLVPASRLPALTPAYDPAHLAELEAARLWEPIDGGYSIIDFLKEQPSRAQVEARRASWTERQERHRHGVTPGTGVNDVRTESRSRTTAVTNGVSHGVTDDDDRAAEAFDATVCRLCHGPATEGNPFVERSMGRPRHRFDPCPAVPVAAGARLARVTPVDWMDSGGSESQSGDATAAPHEAGAAESGPDQGMDA
jgi:hypothetical protein